ncbi:MAG: glycerol kinase GlpK [Proteobacteria bacterium]|jgi:glycerol kinase|nr:glycerol kinase GlpK [Pseudomonadota bacterium]
MYIMAIDQGTTGTTVSILDQAGSLVTKVNQEYRQIFPRPGWVEHDPEDIWQSVTVTIRKALNHAHLKGEQVAAIGITNQRETVIGWNSETGKPVYNAIVWQCRRTEPFCQKLKKKGIENEIRKKTGLVIDPYFSATKMNWILENVPEAKKLSFQGKLKFGTIDTFLLWRLTSGRSFKTDVSNASRTMLMNLKTLQWDSDLCKLFKVRERSLAEICDSSGIFGETQNVPCLPNGIPISGIAGDQQAALFGQVAFQTGESKCTFGTGSFLLMNTGNQLVFSKNKLLTTVAWKLPGQKVTYALEGGAFICGAAVQWLRDGLGMIKQSSEIEALAKQVDSSGGVEFVPALTGLGAPYWDSAARGLICGLTRGTTKAHIARATLEAMALQNVEILLAMQQDLGKKIPCLKVDGGASSNNLLMQLQANFTGIQVERPELIETTSIGAAYLAGLGVGFWKSIQDLKKVWKRDRVFQSQFDNKRRNDRLRSWQMAVAKTQLKTSPKQSRMKS